MREMTFPAPGTASIPLVALPGPADGGMPSIQRAVAGPGTSMGTASPVTARPALALARPPAAVAPTYVQASVPGPSIRRIVPDATGAGVSSPVVQASRSGAAGLPSLTVTPTAQRVDASPAPATTTASTDRERSDRELDQLAQDLFGRMRTRLRSEVIQEREARGLGFDTF